MALLDPTSLYITLPWLFLTILESTLYSTIALLHSTSLYITLQP